jgi:xanthine dehydrogenase accessory factor
MRRDILTQLIATKADRQSVALVTDLQTGAQRIVTRANADAALEKAFRFDKSGVEGDQFIAIYNPPLRLVITGAVLIAQSLIPMAKAAGYDVSVVDPRGAFATGARFPNISLHTEWPDDVMPRIGLDMRTAFVALTHDPKIDDPALELALKSPAFYIGALGSKKTQGARFERLKSKGFTDADLSRINGPIGLDIGAVGAAEIAISIMAAMTKALRHGN